MKNKTFLLLAFLMLFGISANAQDNGISFGLRGGVNMQNFNGKDLNGDKLEMTMVPRFNVGIVLGMPVAPEFYFQPGLMFATKGSKDTGVLLTSTYKLSYIELPLNLVYKGLLGSGHVMLGFGPYVAYAIGGKMTTEGGSVSLESDIEFKNEVAAGDPLLVPYFKALDAGGNIFVGYEMAAGIFLQLNTQFGMLKINPDDLRFPDTKAAIRNTGYSLSLGYRF